MFVTVDFWVQLIPLLAIGFVARYFGVSARYLLGYLFLISCIIIFSIDEFTLAILGIFVVFSLAIQYYIPSQTLAAFLKIGFLIGIKVAFISNWISFLPFGISFVVFQSISYSVDYQRDARKIGNFSMPSYLLMFPQVFAGPIIKYKDFRKQTDNLFRFDLRLIKVGMVMVLFGILYKEMLSGSVSSQVENIFVNLPDRNIVEVYLGGILFGVQIYSDFFAYSLIALGLCRVIGFIFPDNFYFPYLSFSLAEFWRRWHISLGRFFHEYVYIPVQRNFKFNKVSAIMLVFVLSGVWHGIGINFIVWGVFHGLMMLLDVYFISRLVTLKALRWIFTINVVIVGWVIFRTADLSNLLDISLVSLIDWSLLGVMLYYVMFLAVFDYVTYRVLYLSSVRIELIIPLLLAIAYGGLVLGDGNNEFIYFQF